MELIHCGKHDKFGAEQAIGENSVDVPTVPVLPQLRPDYYILSIIICSDHSASKKSHQPHPVHQNVNNPVRTTNHNAVSFELLYHTRRSHRYFSFFEAGVEPN